jgi:hypothetical protein
LIGYYFIFSLYQDLSRHFEANDLEYNIEDFDFMLDPILKRLRQILKASQPSSTHSNSREAQHQPPVTADCAGNSILSGNNSTPYELLGASPLSPPHRSALHTPSVDVLPPGRTSNSSRPSPNSRLGQQRQPQQLLAVNATPASSLPGESSSPDSGDKSRVSWHLNFLLGVFVFFSIKWICPQCGSGFGRPKWIRIFT